MTTLALDTSAAVPFLVRTHDSHRAVRQALIGHDLVLTSQSLAETYSVLTRLPATARLAPSDAVRLIEANFGRPVIVAEGTLVRLPAELATGGIAGGAVYDGLVGLAARDSNLDLVTRDQRAATTYAALGITFRLLPV